MSDNIKERPYRVEWVSFANMGHWVASYEHFDAAHQRYLDLVKANPKRKFRITKTTVEIVAHYDGA